MANPTHINAPYTQLLSLIIINGAELAGATGARAPVLFLPRPEILGHILYVLSRFSGQIPEIPRPRPVVHLHYLGHFGASAYIVCKLKFNLISQKNTL